jgi:hypothetical protein
METEAYNSGNIMNFRDFEDNYKQRNRKMNKLQENRLKKLSGLLKEQFAGYTGDLRAADPKSVERVAAVLKSFEPEEPKMARMPKQVSTCPDGTMEDDQGRCLNPSGKVVAVIKSQFTPKLAATRPKSSASPAGPVAGTKGTKKRKIRYRVCRNAPFKVGCKGDIVQGLQRLLHAALKLKSPVDSFADKFYGGATEKAVEAFQRKNRIRPTGVIDKKTLETLSKSKSKPKVSKAGAQNLRQRVGQKTASPAGPAAPPAARPIEMTRIEAMRRAKEDIVPKLRRVRTRSYKRGLVRYLTIGLRELLDVQKMDPAKAYRTLLNIFGQGGAKYISPNYRSQSLMPDEQRAKMSDAWKRNYENALNKTLEEL